MPDTTHRLVGADENPADADGLILVDDGEAAPPPPPEEDDGGLLPAPDNDGRTAARHLQQWLADRYNVHRRNPVHVWGALRRTPGAFVLARRKGYDQFRCRTHGMIHCRECACPNCGAPGGCSCGSRKVKGYREHPPLPRKVMGIRRASIEAEMMFSDRTALQRGLGEYPWGHDDSSLQPEDGWTYGAEFKINGYATEASSKIRCDIIDRIGKVGGVGAPRRTGLHVHVEADSDSPVTLRQRWEAIEEDLFRVFPSRREQPSASYCYPLRGRGLGAMSDHHSVFCGVTRYGTWEIRIHPGSTSWVAAACWVDWCVAFIEGRTSKTGEAYLNARRAQLAVNPGKGFPWAWRRAIERWHLRNGRNYRSTLSAIASGTFRRFETADGLRAALQTT